MLPYFIVFTTLFQSQGRKRLLQPLFRHGEQEDQNTSSENKETASIRSKWYQHHQRKKQQTPVFIQSTLMVQLLLTSFFTKQQLVRLGGGGWTVFQKRLDGPVDFHRSLTDSKNRFGNLNGELWLGLDRIHRLTTMKNKLREDLTAFKWNTAYVLYDVLSSERTKYKLSLGKYSGNYSGQNRKK